jgi:transcriptional regulator with XRE-family HTH domain
MTNQFGERLRQLREKQDLFLRQVASALEMDTAHLSKIEKGVRQLKKEQIAIVADVLNADKDELTTLWLADQVIGVVKDDSLGLKALQVAEHEIKQKKSKA